MNNESRATRLFPSVRRDMGRGSHSGIAIHLDNEANKMLCPLGVLGPVSVCVLKNAHL